MKPGRSTQARPPHGEARPQSRARARLLTLGAVGLAALGLLAWVAAPPPPKAPGPDPSVVRRVNAVLEAEARLEARLLNLSDKVRIPRDRTPWIAEYLDGLRQIDLSGCPADFRGAYLALTQAWADHLVAARDASGWGGLRRPWVDSDPAAPAPVLTPIEAFLLGAGGTPSRTGREVALRRQQFQAIAHRYQPGFGPTPSRSPGTPVVGPAS